MIAEDPMTAVAPEPVSLLNSCRIQEMINNYQQQEVSG